MGEDNDTSEGRGGRDCGDPALRLSPLPQISVFVLAFLLAAHQLRDFPSAPEGKRKRRGLFLFFCPSIFHSRVTFFHYLPNAISFRELTSGETERVLASCDEAVRKVNFIGWFVDGWGKIDPGQMGDDNRQTAERKD